MSQERIDITRDVNDYFALKNAAEAYSFTGEEELAGNYSDIQSNLHSKIASNICFYNQDSEAARKVMAEFFKKASPYSDLFGKSSVYSSLTNDDSSNKIDYSKINLRSYCFIYNDPESNSVKVTVESSMDNINAKVEFTYEDGKLSDKEGEPVKICIPLDTFRSQDEDPNSIPFNKRAENIIRGYGLVPAYWTSGYSHATRWFCDGITREEAKRLLSNGNGDKSGGKYQYIMYDLKTESTERDLNIILENIKKLF